MNKNQKLVVIGTITAVTLPALIVLGRKVSNRVKEMRTETDVLVGSSTES